MTLNAPLVTGNTYTIQFYDKADATLSPGVPISIGLSTTPGTLGTNIYTGPIPTPGVWSARIFSFVAPNNGQYISVSSLAATRWTHIDNFAFVGCSTPTLAITPSSTVCAGSAVTLTVSGAASYTWSPALGLSTTTGTAVVATPSATTVYTVIGAQGTCTAAINTTITVTPSPTITINPATASICRGSSVA